MRAYLYFQCREAWCFHLLAEDCRTVLTGWRDVADAPQLLRIIARLHGSAEHAQEDIQRWNRGGVWVDLSPPQCRYFGIR